MIFIATTQEYEAELDKKLIRERRITYKGKKTTEEEKSAYFTQIHTISFHIPV